MIQSRIEPAHLPAVLYGAPAETVWLFVHGKCGCKEEGEAFAEIVCPKGAQVAAVDLPEHGERKAQPGFDPWRAVPELKAVMAELRRKWSGVSLRANSIGAWFSMLAFAEEPPAQALFVSPILDMERLIADMMTWAGVDEARLAKEKTIQTAFGETLSWDYLQYARAHRISDWRAPTSILYAGLDNLTSRGTVDDFAKRFACSLQVMEDGEHWFHTPGQLKALQAWEDARTGTGAPFPCENPKR